jgi:succinate dehydrogenase/fumarate reductase cytochrome b subunit
MSIKKVFIVVLFMRVMSGRLEGIVLSIIVLRFQYSLKVSFSSTLAGVYLYYGLLLAISSAASASSWWITFATPLLLLLVVVVVVVVVLVLVFHLLV